jgi:hypothetical protein
MQNVRATRKDWKGSVNRECDVQIFCVALAASALLLHSKRMRLNASDGTKLPWRKLLYVKQDYPDNYVDDTFLDALQKNG